MQLRLHPLASGSVEANAGPQLQGAFLDLVRQADPTLADELHIPDRRRPYTLGMLQGFHHLRPEQQAEALDRGQTLAVHPGQVYWLRITTLDAAIFDSFVRALLLKAQSLVFRIGQANFAVSRLITQPEEAEQEHAQVASSSFAELYLLEEARECYRFAFSTPTVFSLGKKSWGKYLHLFPEPASVFDSLACQWENFAPVDLRLERHNLTPRGIKCWCEEYVVVSDYALTTSHLHAKRFGQIGFQGTITYDVKGNRKSSEARWLSTLARFAFFSGVGYKTTMGMGQARCLSLHSARHSNRPLEESSAQ